MKILQVAAAILCFLAAAFFATCFLYASWLILQGRAGRFTDKHGWFALAYAHTAVFIVAGLIAWAGIALLRYKRVK